MSQVETPIARGSRVQRQAFIMGLRDRRSKQPPPYGARDRQPSIWLLSYQGDLALTLVSLFLLWVCICIWPGSLYGSAFAEYESTVRLHTALAFLVAVPSTSSNMATTASAPQQAASSAYASSHPQYYATNQQVAPAFCGQPVRSCVTCHVS